MADALRLFGLRAVVTGADSGIGEAIARTLAKHGAEVLAVRKAAQAAGLLDHTSGTGDRVSGDRPLGCLWSR